jgi:hypothetical protein
MGTWSGGSQWCTRLLACESSSRFLLGKGVDKGRCDLLLEQYEFLMKGVEALQ